MPTVDWNAFIDGYCERTDATYWSEPLNALSNLSFIVAAVVGWRMARAASDRSAQLLALGAAAIGVGSYLFHTHATIWAMQADVLPIRGFVLVFVAMAAARFWGAPWWVGLVAAGGFVMLSAGLVAGVGRVVGRFHGSLGYTPIALVMIVVSTALARRAPDVSRGLLTAAAIFLASLTLRTIDPEVCAAWPLGTHFGWHLLNGVVVGLMIAVFIRARPKPTATAPRRRARNRAAPRRHRSPAPGR